MADNDFIIFPDGQIALRSLVVAVKKTTLIDTGRMVVRIALDQNFGAIDIKCQDEEEQDRKVHEISNLVLKQSTDAKPSSKQRLN